MRDNGAINTLKMRRIKKRRPWRCEEKQQSKEWKRWKRKYPNQSSGKSLRLWNPVWTAHLTPSSASSFDSKCSWQICRKDSKKKKILEWVITLTLSAEAKIEACLQPSPRNEEFREPRKHRADNDEGQVPEHLTDGLQCLSLWPGPGPSIWIAKKWSAAVSTLFVLPKTSLFLLLVFFFNNQKQIIPQKKTANYPLILFNAQLFWYNHLAFCNRWSD